MTEEIKAIVTDYPATTGTYLHVDYTGSKFKNYINIIPLAHGPVLRDVLNERFPVTPPEPEAELEPEPFRVYELTGGWKVSRRVNEWGAAYYYYGSGVTKESALARATKLAEELNVEDRERKAYRLDENGDRFTITKRDKIGGWWTVAVYYYDPYGRDPMRGVTRAGAEAEAKALLAKLNAKH